MSRMLFFVAAATLLALTVDRPAVARQRHVDPGSSMAHRTTARHAARRPHGGFTGASSAAGIARDLGY